MNVDDQSRPVVCIVTVSSLFKQKGLDLWVSKTFAVSKEIPTVYKGTSEK